MLNIICAKYDIVARALNVNDVVIKATHSEHIPLIRYLYNLHVHRYFPIYEISCYAFCIVSYFTPNV